MHKLYLKWLKFLCNFIARVCIESYNIVSKQPVSGQFIIIITKPLQQPFLMALFTIILFYISNFWSCTQNNMVRPFILGSKGWHRGESARLPPMRPEFKSRRCRHMWVEFVVVVSLLCSERFFSGYSGFPLSSKTNISKFQFDQESGRWRTTLWMYYLQSIIYFISIIKWNLT